MKIATLRDRCKSFTQAYSQNPRRVVGAMDQVSSCATFASLRSFVRGGNYGKLANSAFRRPRAARQVKCGFCEHATALPPKRPLDGNDIEQILRAAPRPLRWVACSALRAKDAFVAQTGRLFGAPQAGAPGTCASRKTQWLKCKTLYTRRRTSA
ncbi:hypothetical protein Turpa_3294 [Turneriella parva DSM 21527]|uniref:Uncharacterized protein n=1 Tax=Turneriella parva (strain ATCC BAA-1111 / DSM 21527 / NCTC 11395 / H) TaxID=869212 RepID=I4B9H5_TURPD|nr:hypothetical protein Turpa_3294 [Turneriella parva DSM 21527]